MCKEEEDVHHPELEEKESGVQQCSLRRHREGRKGAQFRNPIENRFFN